MPLRNPAGLTYATRRHAARGVSSLIVVVILLAVMAAGVVFTNRNLIVEQKTSANQYRATMAAEAAEAGLEWAAAMMNMSNRIGATCTPSVTVGDPTFKLKYHTQDANTGALTPVAKTGGVHAACVANADGSNGWTCSCPAAGTAPAPAGGAPASGFQPSFAIAFDTSPTTGTTSVTAFGCTSRITSSTCSGDAAARATVTLGPIAALGSPPAAPLTARGMVNIGNAALEVVNPDPTTNGITINAGLGITAPNVNLTTVPGTPPKTTLVGNDPSLRDLTEDQMFASYMGMDKETFKNLPAVKTVTCTPCTETTLTNAYSAAGGNARMIWVEGDLTMNSNITLGSITDPVIVVVTGNVTLSADIVVYGLVYGAGLQWNNTGGGSAVLYGAAIAEGNYTGNGTPTYYYDASVLNRLRYLTGAYARVPGSWRDFQ